jgi:hypothetical protein
LRHAGQASRAGNQHNSIAVSVNPRSTDMAALNTRSGTALYMIGFLWACVNVHTVHLGTHRKRLLFEPANKVLVHHVNEDLLLRAFLRHLYDDL